MMLLIQLEAWVATVLTCLEQRVKRGGHRQKLYAATLKSYESEAVGQLTIQVRRFLQISKLEELKLSSEVTGRDPKNTGNGMFYVSRGGLRELFVSLL